MKKILFTLMLLTTISFAQENINKKVKFGGHIGINWSSVKGDNSGKLDVKNGAYIGIFTRHRIAENFMIQPEFNYSSKGATRRIVINNNQLDFSVKFDYLEFPVILKYNFGSNYSDKVKPELFFGGFGAFHLRSSVSLDEVPDSDVNISEVKNMDYGILFGTAVGFKIDNVDILLELRYTMSLPSYDNSNSNFDVRHSVFSIGTGFVIN